MSERLARSEEEVEHGRSDLLRKNQELDERRRLMETVLETVGTGVLVVDHEGTATAMNAAACRLLDLRSETVVGLSVRAGPSRPRACTTCSSSWSGCSPVARRARSARCAWPPRAATDISR